MKLLMCPPLYYRTGAEERKRALSQWRTLYRLLREELSVDVDLLEPRPDLPDLAHVGNGGFLAGDTFIAGGLADALQKPESEPLENFFLVRGYHIAHCGKGVRFEGNRDLVPCNSTLFTAFNSAEQQGVQAEIQAVVEAEVVGLDLANGWPGPLATGLCPLGEGAAFFCAAAFTDEAREKVESRIPKLIPVDEKAGGAVIHNSLIVGSDVIVAESDVVVRPTLESVGLTVHELALDEFSGAGGPRSLALRIGES